MQGNNNQNLRWNPNLSANKVEDTAGTLAVKSNGTSKMNSLEHSAKYVGSPKLNNKDGGGENQSPKST